MILTEHRLLSLVGLALLLGAGRAAAQAPEDRRALERFRTTLDSISSPDRVAALEDSLIGLARVARDNAMLHLRLGFVAIRLGELSSRDEAESRRRYNDAGSEFEWATQLEPKWPYGWYGLGLAELGVGDSESILVAGLQTMLGKDALTRSASAFARSAAVDPGFELGLVELTNTALKQRTNVRTDVALAALRRAGRTAAASNRDVMLARGRVERRIGSLDSSRAVLSRLLSRDSSDQMVRYQLARTRFLESDSGAGELWYSALGSGDSTVAAAISRDLEVILPDSVMSRLHGDSPEQRVATMRHFWNQRDDRALRPRGSRLEEHYRRLDHAMRAFQLVAPHRQFDIVERYRSGQDRFDDRGITWIRHGRPDQRVQYSAPGINPNESWLYRRDGGNLILHFVARQDVQDFRLVESLFDVLGFETAMLLPDSLHLRNDSALGGVQRAVTALLESRLQLAPIYGKMMTAGPAAARELLTEERHDGAVAIERAMSSDDDPLRFRSTLQADAMFLAAGQSQDAPLLQFAFAIAPDRPGADSFPVRVRIAAQRLDGSTLARSDTVMILPGAELVGIGRRVVGRLAAAVPPGVMMVRAAVSIGPRGAVTQLDTISVPDPSGNRLAVSDLVLGTAGMPIGLPLSRGDTAWINPAGVYPNGRPMSLYFEVSGLPAGARYQIEFKIQDPGGGIFRKIFGGGTALELKFDRAAPGGVDRIYREVSLRNVEPGDYLIEVKVSSDSGEVKRSRSVEVTG